MKIFWVAVSCAVQLALVGCAGEEPTSSEPMQAPNTVDVTIQTMDFQMPESIPMGWTTFRVTNNSAMTHMGVIERMPEGYGLREQQDEVAPVFQQGMDLIIEGDMEAAMAKFGEIPEWFGEIEFLGGPGLMAPGEVTETTVLMEPGTYLLECYVKTDGRFHSYNPSPGIDGMVAQFRVTDEPNGAPEPSPTIGVTIDSENGMTVIGEGSAGPQTISVHFADQQRYENFAGHDVHLVRLTPETDEDALIAWMNWTLPAGLQTPAPARFLGGAQELPAGRTEYFTADLKPGDYAFIAEVPEADEKGMYRRFTVR